MRVRITGSMHGSIDGIDLTRFVVGSVYDMGTSLGNYLMASGYAEPIADESPALITPLDQSSRLQFTKPTLDQAADRPRRR